MPIYVYICLQCNKEHEEIQRLSDPPLTKCPEPDCTGSLTKQITKAGFKLKGQGFYATDYSRSTINSK